MIDVKTLSDEALSELKNQIQAEQVIRQDIKKKELWEAVRKSLQNYIENFGAIMCYDGFEDMSLGTISDVRTMVNEVGVLYLN